MTTWLNVTNNAQSALYAGITAAATSLTLLSGEGAKFPAASFNISIADEILYCSSRTGDVLTVVRAQEGTTAAIHAISSTVSLNVTAGIISQIQAAIDAHAALVNTTPCRAYLSATQSYLLCNSVGESRAQLDSVDYDLGSNFKTGYVFNQVQADSSGCSATLIKKTGALFTTVTGQTNGLKFALVTWSSDAGGTTNTGSGYITTVTDANNLVILKSNGADFANSYYFTIKQSWYLVPTTGLYVIKASTTYQATNIVADKIYGVEVLVNGAVAGRKAEHASFVYYMYVMMSLDKYLTAGDLVSLSGLNSSGVNTQQYTGGSAYTYLSIMKMPD